MSDGFTGMFGLALKDFKDYGFWLRSSNDLGGDFFRRCLNWLMPSAPTLKSVSELEIALKYIPFCEHFLVLNCKDKRLVKGRKKIVQYTR